MALETKEFQAESKELLNLMINSIYSNKEIFLRELISNASDAIDKRKYQTFISNGKYPSFDKPEIWLEVNEEERSITIKDNGIGMGREELINNIGTIAKSGSKEFLKKVNEEKNKGEALDIIGQFGVGFYSAFMVAKKVIIETRSIKYKKGYRFESEGSESYSIQDIDKEDIGTNIKLYLKDDTEEVDYTQYLNNYTLEYLVEKYSNYIKYPILLNVTEKEPKKDENGKEIENEYETKIVTKTLNSMVPLWKKNKKDVKDEELNEFYKSNFKDYQDPLYSMMVNVEGMFTYQAIIYVPSRLRNEIYNRENVGLSLYAKNVFIMDKCKDLLPHYLYFLEGVVDSSDLDLNISREMLQENRNISRIRNSIENKFISNLKELKENDFNKYLEIYKLYGASLKYGIYESYGSKNDLLKDLLVFKSLKHEDEYIDLKKYVSEMKEGQKAIYFASGTSISEIKLSPELERFRRDDIDVLFFDKDVDEFAIRALNKYEDKEFKSVSEFNENDISKEEKERLEDLTTTYKRQLDEMKEALKDKVSDVRFSSKLVDSPVAIVNKDGLSLNMEKIINALNEVNQIGNDAFKSEKVLEINPDHEIFNKMKELNDDDIKDYATLLYNEALILGGVDIQDKEEFTRILNKILLK